MPSKVRVIGNYSCYSYIIPLSIIWDYIYYVCRLQLSINTKALRCVAASKNVFMHMHCTLCIANVQSRPSEIFDCTAHCSVQQFTSQQNFDLLHVHPTARRYEILLICKPNLHRKVCNALFLLVRKNVYAYLRKFPKFDLDNLVFCSRVFKSNFV